MTPADLSPDLLGARITLTVTRPRADGDSHSTYFGTVQSIIVAAGQDPAAGTHIRFVGGDTAWITDRDTWSITRRTADHIPAGASICPECGAVYATLAELADHLNDNTI